MARHSVFLMTVLLATNMGTAHAAHRNHSSAVHAPSFTLRWSHSGNKAFIDGRHWPARATVDVTLTQALGYRSPLKLPAVTGVIVRSNRRGHFRILMPNLAICNLRATIHARSGALRVPPIAPRGVCMETDQPVIPVERFKVVVGTRLGSAYAANHIHQRYGEQLGADNNWGGRPLRRSRAVTIALAQAHAIRRAPVSTKRGSVPVGLSGLWTSAWEVWVGGVHVPRYGQGHLVVLIVRAKQHGVSFEHRGMVLGSWFAP